MMGKIDIRLTCGNSIGKNRLNLFDIDQGNVSSNQIAGAIRSLNLYTMEGNILCRNSRM